MLIGEAFRDRIHPHADAIYRSAADVRVSPSLDDEINKLRRTTTPRAVVSDGPGGSRLFSAWSGHRNDDDGPCDAQTLGLSAPAEVAANRSKMD